MGMPCAAQLWRVFHWCGAAALALGAAAAAEEFPNPRYTGGLAIREWSEEEVLGNSQFFSITQAPATGLIYAGGGSGVLEYDGVRWRQLPLLGGQRRAMRGLVVDGRGRIWAGGDNEILRYTADDRGFWQVESLMGWFSDADRAVGPVWQLHELAGAVWGTATNCVIRLGPDDRTARRWATAGDLVIIGEVDGKVWFRQQGGAIFWGHGDTFGRAALPELPTGAIAMAAYRSASGTLRLDHLHGVLELADGQWREIAPELNRMLRGDSAAQRARRLPDGRGIFSTRSRALIFVAADGRVLGRLAEPPGVTFGVTPQLFLDRDGGLWMANANGIRRVQVDGAVARHDRTTGVRGGVRDLNQQGPTLFAATAQGLFSRHAETGRFELRSRGLSDLFKLARSPAGGWFIAAGRNFSEWGETADVVLPGIPRAGVAVVIDPGHPDRVFVGGINAVTVLRRGGAGWQEEGRLSETGVVPYSLAASDGGVLWVANSAGPGLWRAAAPGGNWRQATLTRAAPVDLTAAAIWQVVRLRGGVVAFGSRGVFRLDDATGAAVEDGRFAGLPEGAATAVLAVAEGGRTGAVYVAGARNQTGRYWRGEPGPDGAIWRWTELPLGELSGHFSLTTMLESDDGRTLWLGGTKYVASVDLEASPPPFPVPAARWRSVRSLDGAERYFGGADVRSEVVLPAGLRAVGFEVSAPIYRTHVDAETGIEFRTRAAGVDAAWTGWSKAAARELTNLPPGAVKVEVQARNHLGAEGPVAALVLTVPPFWWETWWWRTVMVLVAVAAVAAAARWVVRRQYRRRIALLEAQAAVQNERLRIARDMHDDLGSTLASIVHLSGRAAGAGTQADGALARIHEASRELVQRTRDIVWAATPQHDSLESLCEQLAAHAERTLGDRGVEVRVALPAEVPVEEVGAGARHDLFLAFKEAVNNCAKYAEARAVTVRVELEARWLVVTLVDDGKGFAPGECQGTGNGLGNLQARMAALGGSAAIASVVGRGTTVTLRLPRIPPGK